MSAILITGGAGFIGSHLTEELVNQGYRVLVYDDLRVGRLENLRCPYEFVKGDIRDYHSLAVAMRDCRYVFHLAVLTGAAGSLKMMEEYFTVNVYGTLNVLKAAAREEGVEKVVFTSTAAVYGDTKEIPETETMRLEPRSPYAISKANGEYCCDMFWRSFGLPTVSTRLFNVFGERQDGRSPHAAAVPLFIKNTLQGLPLPIYGDGTQTRDFIYVKDVVKALILLMKEGSGIYNVGSGQEVDINALLLIIQQCLNQYMPIRYLPERPGELRRCCASVQKLAALGFRPDYSLRDGLIRTITDFTGKSPELCERIG